MILFDPASHGVSSDEAVSFDAGHTVPARDVAAHGVGPEPEPRFWGRYGVGTLRSCRALAVVALRFGVSGCSGAKPAQVFDVEP